MDLRIFHRNSIVTFTLALILGILQHAQTEPNPLISSSGLVPIRPSNESQSTKPQPQIKAVNDTSTTPEEISKTTMTPSTTQLRTTTSKPSSSSIIRSFPDGRMGVVQKLEGNKEEPSISIPHQPNGTESAGEKGHQLLLPILSTTPPPSTIEAIEHSIFSESVSDKDSKNVGKDEGVKRGVSLWPYNEDKSVEGTSDTNVGDTPGTPVGGGITEGTIENEVEPEEVEEEPEPEFPIFKMGPPWEDKLIVGVKGNSVKQIEISFALASKLCQAIEKDDVKSGNNNNYLYLWAPINQYVPLIHKGFPVRPPLFTRECLKWVHKPCNGKPRRPMLKPCSYWAPQPILRPECGFDAEKRFKMVNYRPEGFSPQNCPCVWPCTRRFDPIQRCRIEIPSGEEGGLSSSNNSWDSEGNPTNAGEAIEVQVNYARQLCRGMKIVRRTRDPVPIGWLPIRVDTMEKRMRAGRSRRGGVKAKRSSPVKRKRFTGVHVHNRGKEKSMRRRFRNPKKSSLRRSLDVGTDDDNDYGFVVDQEFHLDDIPAPNEYDETPMGADNPAPDEYDETPISVTFNPDRHTENEVDNGPPKGGDGKDDYGGGVGDTVSSVKTTLTTQSCRVWKYKVCSKSETNEGSNSIYRRKRVVGKVSRKRSLLSMTFDQAVDKAEAETSGVANSGNVNFDPIATVTGAPTGAGGNEDDGVEEGTEPGPQCDQWYPEQSDSCTPEVQLDRDGMPMAGRSMDDDEGSSTSLLVREPCPGGSSFPCFLRRRKKRGISLPAFDETMDLDGENFDGTGNWEEPPIDEGAEEDPDHTGDPIFQRPEGGEMTPTTPAPPNYKKKIEVIQDMGCRCDWPCLPFYDRINRCYDDRGNTIVDQRGKPLVSTRSFRKHQRDPVSCFSFVESNDVICKIKGRRRRG